MNKRFNKESLNHLQLLHIISNHLTYPVLPLTFLPSPPFPAAASRWARSWPWAGSAPRRPWTGASSGTSSWHGSSRCLWPACSAPPSWPCSSTAFCPSSEGTPPGGRAEEEGKKEGRSVGERGRAWVKNLCSSVRGGGLVCVADKGEGK